MDSENRSIYEPFYILSIKTCLVEKKTDNNNFEEFLTYTWEKIIKKKRLVNMSGKFESGLRGLSQ